MVGVLQPQEPQAYSFLASYTLKDTDRSQASISFGCATEWLDQVSCEVSVVVGLPRSLMIDVCAFRNSFLHMCVHHQAVQITDVW